ncbi:MAG: hypothetical protein A3C93_01310 [Candidatus Lloydbacteria bacterium RIFCSPHIGHO2_02_FULL_54_17]|uniref:Glycosyltransferase RgtA/B/C/D-like domain-containing protein n=1 Tax=Candidatus Lloydbacteria bacterium RIFCSPHIGHO2_02_FULL_54_17 TaxID=1798664 RepID=A0A1G2DIZ7_9BACT|nr:MAG: hypothetical protein A2762_05720 [Candidatus Lloydbacteria bacterium RIFCSPHIGHO2_01_FULL_54_11]OGZ13637.1 MAG: hypothetical protein A3C93_01310 [Candidatus Lloydbacteria bacterium RIFCSPHIGHO2_02_FULL_54_17]OGZ14788.1 MAG: hypothetical protein A3H76_06990 [Candidatus Lloydbacteria bacterium RIFCSPLOWO2_02_FULL_54_12]OGZ15448.1 MAG: hypothetical protein A2948_04215 [Candidatus Lloydbacteria bacterium RIFCSPLOWO2_01_FULL_54_18]
MREHFAKLSSISRTHVIAIVFALFVGALVLAPQVIFIVNEGEHYQGLYMMMTGKDEEAYLARMQEFYDEGRIGNPYLYEYKHHGPQFFPWGVEMMQAYPGKWLGVSVPTMNLVYKFLLPAIQFLLIYALAFRLTRSRSWSIAGALMVLLGLAWLEWRHIVTLISFDLNYFWDFIPVSRPVNPQWSQILLFAYLYVLLLIHDGGNRRWFFVLGALFALAFFTYFFSWTFLLALNAIFVGIWLLFGKRSLAGDLVLTSVGAILLAYYPLREIVLATTHPDYSQVVGALKVAPQHRPILYKPWLFVSVLFAAYFFLTKAYREFDARRGHALFVGGLLATCFLVLNQQVVTGVVLQYAHYMRYFSLPIFAVIYAYLAVQLIGRYIPSAVHTTTEPPRLPSPHRVVIAVLPWVFSAVFIATGILMQYSGYQSYVPIAHDNQRYMSALVWLNENTPKDSVVMTNQDLSELVPIFTHNNVVWNNLHILPLYFVPPERVKFTPENLLAAPDFLSASRAYRLDYVLWDTKKDPDWKIDTLGLPLLYSGDGLNLYELPK